MSETAVSETAVLLEELLDLSVEPYTVPLYQATDENFRCFGRLVHSFEEEEVEIVTWPQTGWRALAPGSGRNGGVHRCNFTCKWKDGVLTVHDSEDGSQHHVARHPASHTELHSHLLVREAAYHPDGGQVLFPTGNHPFVMLLGPPGDDIQLTDFVAFYFDGSFGFQIKPKIWHLGVLTLHNDVVFRNKQGKVLGIIEVNTVKEFGKYIKVPMIPNLVSGRSFSEDFPTK